MTRDPQERRVAIVTGGASGIGEAIVQRLAADGAAVVVADLDGEAASAVAKDVDGLAVRIDVSTEIDVEAVFARTVERYGRVDAVFNNAGLGGRTADIVGLSVEEFDRVYAVNTRGVFLGTRAALRRFTEQGPGGVVVNTAALAGITAMAAQPAYTAAKHAVIGFTRVAAAQAARVGARVNAVLPGMIDTPGLRAQIPVDGGPDSFGAVARIPAGRPGTAEELAAAAVWLADPETAYVNGIALPVDGGFLAVAL